MVTVSLRHHRTLPSPPQRRQYLRRRVRPLRCRAPAAALSPPSEGACGRNAHACVRHVVRLCQARTTASTPMNRLPDINAAAACLQPRHQRQPTAAATSILPCHCRSCRCCRCCFPAAHPAGTVQHTQPAPSRHLAHHWAAITLCNTPPPASSPVQAVEAGTPTALRALPRLPQVCGAAAVVVAAVAASQLAAAHHVTVARERLQTCGWLTTCAAPICVVTWVEATAHRHGAGVCVRSCGCVGDRAGFVYVM